MKSQCILESLKLEKTSKIFKSNHQRNVLYPLYSKSEAKCLVIASNTSVCFCVLFFSSRNPDEIYSLLLHYFVLTAGSRDCMFWLESAIVAK